MSKLTSGNVTITLAGEEVVLKPTPRAAVTISNHFTGLHAAVPRIVGQDIAAMSVVIAAGAGIKGEAAKGLNDKVYRAGLSNIAADLVEFIIILMNGGKRPDDTDAAEDDGEDGDEGNAED